MEINHSFENSFLNIELTSLVSLENSSLVKLDRYIKKSLDVLSDFISEELGSIIIDGSKIDFSITICDSSRMIELNNSYRNKNKTTDVLSFPVHENLRNSNARINDKLVCLGDIFVCHEVAIEQSKSFDLSFEEEFLHLYIHGFLHLCGYDHEVSAEQERIMQGFESKLLKKVALLLA